MFERTIHSEATGRRPNSQPGSQAWDGRCHYSEQTRDGEMGELECVLKRWEREKPNSLCAVGKGGIGGAAVVRDWCEEPELPFTWGHGNVQPGLALKDTSGLWPYHSQLLCWCSWPLLPPRAIQMSRDATWGHTEVWEPCCHWRTCLGPWSYCSRGLYWDLWAVLPPKVMQMSVIWTATWEAVLIFVCCWTGPALPWQWECCPNPSPSSPA